MDPHAGQVCDEDARWACPSGEVLRAFHLGELADAQILRVGEHLASCPRCEQQARLLDGLSDQALAALCRPVAAESGHQPAWAGGGYPELPARAGSAPDIPGYEVLSLLGRGGMGIVWKARHRRLDRLVALKCLHAGGLPDLQRFQAEAQAVARLQHPNIVQIYEVGEWQGQPFLTLEYLDGGTLADHLTSKPQDARAAAALVQTLARAVHYAHTRGIVHRDLKPANILFQGLTTEAQRHREDRKEEQESVEQWQQEPSASGLDSSLPSSLWLCASVVNLLPKIADFGIAKQLQVSGQTREGDVCGTAAYMAPEQAAGRAMGSGPTSDIYSLGVILYEMLTGRVPLQGATDLETVLLVQKEEPVPPRQLQPGLPRDLETIVLKAIAKEPGRRYPTAAELAEDLGRFLAGEPIRARRIGLGERGVKWVKRRPAEAALLAVSAVTALSLVVGILVHSAQLGAALQEAHTNLEKARVAEEQARFAGEEKTRQLAIALVREAQARRNSGQVGRRFESLVALKKAVAHFRALGQLDEERTLELRNEAIACLTHTDLKPGKKLAQDPDWSRPNNFHATSRYYVLRSAADNHPEKDDVNQGQLSVRRVADDQEVVRLPGFGVRVVETRFSPDGRYLAAQYEWGKRHNYVWDLSRREALVKVPYGIHGSSPAFSPDSRLVALPQSDQSIRIWELPSGTPWKDLTLGPRVQQVRFHPDGRRLAVVSGSTIQLRDLEGGKELATFQHPGGVAALAWRDDGKVFATGCYDHDIYLWDVAKPAQPLRVLKGHFGEVVHLAFSHGGDLLFSNSWDSTNRLWDPRTGQQLLSKPGGLYYEHQFGPDDQGLDYGWQVATGRECRTFHGPKGLRWVAVSPQGRLLASVCADRVQLWDLTAIREGNKELTTLAVGLGARAHFDPKDGSLITDGNKAGLQRWPITPDPETGGLRIGPPLSLGLSARAPLLFRQYDPDFTISADGRTLAHSPQNGKVLLYDPENPGRKLLVEESPSQRFPALSPNGRWLATGNWHGRGVKVWNTRTGELAQDFDLGELEEGTAWPAFSPDGKWLVTGTYAEYRFWEVGSWQKKHGLPRANAGQAIGWITFSPDSRMLAVLDGVSEVRLVDPATGREFARLVSAGRPYCFSPDGSQLMTYAGRDGAFQVWDLRLIRRQLTEMGLDWDLPPYPPPSPLTPLSGGEVQGLREPLRIQVLAAEPPPPSAELDAQAHLERGLLSVQMRHYGNAVADFKQAGTLDPQRPPGKM